jgi:hypothetical protein
MTLKNKISNNGSPAVSAAGYFTMPALFYDYYRRLEGENIKDHHWT